MQDFFFGHDLMFSCVAGETNPVFILVRALFRRAADSKIILSTYWNSQMSLLTLRRWLMCLVGWTWIMTWNRYKQNHYTPTIFTMCKYITIYRYIHTYIYNMIFKHLGYNIYMDICAYLLIWTPDGKDMNSSPPSYFPWSVVTSFATCQVEARRIAGIPKQIEALQTWGHLTGYWGRRTC